MTNNYNHSLQLGLSLRLLDPEEKLATLSIFRGSAVKTLELYEPVFTASNPRPGDLRGVLADNGIAVRSVHAAFGGRFDLSAQDPARRSIGVAAAMRAIELAGRAGARIVVVHASGEPIAPEERPARLQCAKDSLGAIVTQAAAQGCRIAVELLPRTCLGRTVEELLDLIGGFDVNEAGLCLDTNHLMAAYRQLPEAVSAMGSHLIALHCSDYDGVDEKHWPPMQGVIDWRAFLDALQAVNFQGPLNYEAQLAGDHPRQRLRFLENNYSRLLDLWRAPNAGAPADSANA